MMRRRRGRFVGLGPAVVAAVCCVSLAGPALAGETADRRESHLAWHRGLAVTTAALLTVQLGLGAGLLDKVNAGEPGGTVRVLHRATGIGAAVVYGGSVAFALTAPDPESPEPPPGTLHDVLTWVTAVGMVAAPALGLYIANGSVAPSDRDSLILTHRVTGVTTTLAVWTLVVATWLE